MFEGDDVSVDAHKIAQHVEMQRTRLKAVGATIAQAFQMWLLPLFLPFCEPRRGDKERLRRGSPTATAIRLPVATIQAVTAVPVLAPSSTISPCAA